MPCCHSPQEYPINSPICVQNLMSWMFLKIADVSTCILQSTVNTVPQQPFPLPGRCHRRGGTLETRGRRASCPRSETRKAGWIEKCVRCFGRSKIHEQSGSIWLEDNAKQMKFVSLSQNDYEFMRAPQTTPKLLSPWYTSLASRFLPSILLKFDWRKFSHRWFCHPLNVGLTFLDPAK